MISYIHDPEYWYIGSDNELGGYLAAEHLIKTGHKTIGYVNCGKGNLLSEIRRNGYLRALNSYNIPFNDKYLFDSGIESYDSGSDRLTMGYNFGKNFLNLDKKPDALCFYNDNYAIGFMQCMLENNIRIPDDIAIVGFDDLDIAKYANVPLTTIRQHTDKIGYGAVELINNRIENKLSANRILYKPELIIRKSCGA
jgi:DNA-binding LacI/PurR family transcriptional regulator